MGNPEGADKPNKKYYDPRVWVREGEKTLSARVKEACTDLGNVGEHDRLDLRDMRRADRCYRNTDWRKKCWPVER